WASAVALWSLNATCGPAWPRGCWPFISGSSDVVPDLNMSCLTNHDLPSIKVDLTKYPSRLCFGNRLARVLWGAVWTLLFRPSPRLLYGWRHFLLRCFG